MNKKAAIVKRTPAVAVQRVVSRQDVDTLYDLLYVCERLYWKNDVGNKQAQDRMDELHSGKNGDQKGFFVQTRNSIDKVRATLPANDPDERRDELK